MIVLPEETIKFGFAKRNRFWHKALFAQATVAHEFHIQQLLCALIFH